MVKNKSYIPNKGDLLWLEFSPQSGHEQSGRRPALCISPEIYNQRVGLAIFCPITSVVKGYPYEVLLPSTVSIKGVILSDQVKSLDWQSRQIIFIEKLPGNILSDVLAKLHTLI